MQNLQIIGNIGQDAQVKETNGKQYVTFSVAVNESYKDKSGTKVEKTDWYNVISGRTAVAPWLKKGVSVYISGKLSTRVYKDQTNEYRVSLDLRERELDLLSSPKDNEKPQS